MSPNLPDAIVSTYGDIIAVGAENRSLSVERGLHQQAGDFDEQSCLTHGHRRLSKSENSDPKLPIVKLEAGNISETE